MQREEVPRAPRRRGEGSHWDEVSLGEVPDPTARGEVRLAASARAFADGGARSLQLWVLDGNVPARAFYAHLGGVRADERPVRGWGGDLSESVYRWEDIRCLMRGG